MFIKCREDGTDIIYVYIYTTYVEFLLLWNA
jgi:hypothetical protein